MQMYLFIINFVEDVVLYLSLQITCEKNCLFVEL